jgi:hypothetical protein
MHPIEVQSCTRLGPRDLTSIELLVIRVNERLGARAPGNFKGIVTGFDAECGVPGGGRITRLVAGRSGTREVDAINRRARGVSQIAETYAPNNVSSVRRLIDPLHADHDHASNQRREVDDETSTQSDLWPHYDDLSH